MKKSEMVELMIEAFCASTGPTTADTYKIKMERVLKAMLKAGMVAPPMEFTVAGKVYRDNGWEKEDG